MEKTDPDLQVIIVNGDNLAHGISMDSDSWNPNSKELYKLNLQQQTTLYNLIRENFPKAVIVPVIGNNDMRYHYEIPEKKENNKIQDYVDLFDIWN